MYAYGDYTVDNFQEPLNNVGEEFLSRLGADSIIIPHLFNEI
nr:hypothetical protein [Pelotomaculum sp. FP]